MSSTPMLAALLLVSTSLGAADTLLMEKPSESPPIYSDSHGDPLPEGAITRLGTVRWRHGYLVNTLAYSPDGKKIAAHGKGGTGLTFWDAATGKELGRFSIFNRLDELNFSADGKMIATTDKTDCFLWDVATGKEVRRLQGHQKVICGVAFAPVGNQVATGSADGGVRLWDTATGKEQRRIDCNLGEHNGLAYSPDGKSVASSGTDGVIHFWDPATGKEQRQLRGHTKAVWRIIFSPDGKRLTSLSEDVSIRRWDVATGQPLQILFAEKIGIEWPIAFSPNGALLAVRHHDGTIRLWDVEQGVEKRRWQADARNVYAVAFSADGKTLATGTTWGIIRLWDVASGRERYPSEDPRGFIDFVRFCSDGSRLVSIGRDCRLLEWDLAAQTPQRQFTWKDEGRSPTALSPDGNTLAVVRVTDFKESLGEVRLWGVRTDKPGRLLGKQKGRASNIAFSPDGRLLASGGEDHLIHVWDASKDKEIQQIKINDVPNGEMSLCFSTDSKALACGIVGNGPSSKPALHLWDVASGKERTQFNVGIQASPYAPRLAFSSDGKVLAFSAENQASSLVLLWDTTSGKELCRYAGHRQWVLALALSPNGKLVASGTLCHPSVHRGQKGSSVHVWEAATGRLIRRFQGHRSFVSNVDFSPDGLSVASGSGDSTILLWDITGRRPDAQWHVKPLTPRQMDACWTALADEDAAKAYDAVWALVAAPEQAVPFLQNHLSPVARPDAKTVARLITDLDSEDFLTRQKATEELNKLGDAITPALQQALSAKPPLEVRRRIQQLLDQSRDWTAERLRVHRTIQALEHIGTQSSRQILRALAEGAPGASPTEEAKSALGRLDKRSASRP